MIKRVVLNGAALFYVLKVIAKKRKEVKNKKNKQN